MGLWLGGIAVASGLAAAPALAAPEAAAFLVDLSDRAIAELTQPDISEAEKEKRFRHFIDEGFDIPAIGRFVLGRYWRSTDEAARQGFLDTFKEMLVHRFLPIFGEYSGERLKVGVVRPLAAGSNIVSVASELVRPDGEPIKVDWRLLQSESGYRIVDIMAEGVSIAVTLRAEYNSVLKGNGGDVPALTRQLRAKLDRG